MIAIPINTVIQGVKSSKLFSNVSMFAIYKPKDESFFYVNNPFVGDGIETAKQLKQWGVKQLAYSFMSPSPFKTLKENGIKMYHIGYQPTALPEIIQKITNGSLSIVDTTGADGEAYLGTTAQCSA